MHYIGTCGSITNTMTKTVTHASIGRVATKRGSGLASIATQRLDKSKTTTTEAAVGLNTTTAPVSTS